MSTYTIEDLRRDLAQTIRDVRNKEDPLDIDRAKVVAELAQTMINSAKVEVDMIRALDGAHLPTTGFIAKQASSQVAIGNVQPESRRRSQVEPLGPSPIGSLK